MKTICLLPKRITAGDHITWQQPWDMAGGDITPKTMELVISFTGGFHLAGGSPQSAGFLFTLDGETTASLPPGCWAWQLYLSVDGRRTTLDSGTVEVIADLAAHPKGYDSRGWLERAIEAVQASLAGRASSAQLEWEFDGTRVKNMSQLEQLDLLERLEKKRAQQQRVEARKKGRRCGLGRMIKVEF